MIARRLDRHGLTNEAAGLRHVGEITIHHEMRHGSSLAVLGQFASSHDSAGTPGDEIRRFTLAGPRSGPWDARELLRVAAVRTKVEAVVLAQSTVNFYYFRDLNVPVYLLAVYAKGEKMNLTAGEKKAMGKMVDRIVEASVARRLKIVNSA